MSHFDILSSEILCKVSEHTTTDYATLTRFFFWPSLWQMEVSRPKNEPMPQRQGLNHSHCSDNTGSLNPCTARELQHNYFELKTLQKQQVQEVLSDSFFLKAGDKNPHKKGTLLVPGRAECSKSPGTHQRKNLRDEPYKNNSHLPLASPCIYIPQSTASKSLNSFPLSCHFSKTVLFFVMMLYKPFAFSSHVYACCTSE